MKSSLLCNNMNIKNKEEFIDELTKELVYKLTGCNYYKK